MTNKHLEGLQIKKLSLSLHSFVMSENINNFFRFTMYNPFHLCGAAVTMCY